MTANRHSGEELAPDLIRGRSPGCGWEGLFEGSHRR